MHADFGGDAPQILAVVEHIGIGHVVEAIDGGLHVQQQFRVAHMLAHAAGIAAASVNKLGNTAR